MQTTDQRKAPGKIDSRLSSLGWAGLAALIAWQAFTSPVGNGWVIATASVIMVLAALPAIKWAKVQAQGLPAYEIMMLTFIPFYAMPLLRGHPATLEYGDETLLTSTLAIICFQLACVAGHRFVEGRPARSSLWTRAVLAENNITLGRAGIIASTIFSYLLNFTDTLPSEFVSILRAMFFGIGTVSVFIVCRAWGEGSLSSAGKLAIGLILFAQVILVATQLYLITVASTILMALIGYITASRKLPIVFAAAVFGLLAILHNGKDEMRSIYWAENYTGEIEVTDLWPFYQQWFDFGMAQHEGNEKEIAGGILERASLFQIMCEITSQSPASQPFLGGATYEALPLLVVPRILWANKPRPHDSNIRLAIYYGFSTEASARNVSIAFGVPSEAFANFGFFGVMGVGFGMGMFFKKITGWGQNASPLSLAGLAQILIIAWSFQAEMTLAVWLSSLYQAAVVLLGIPWAYRYFTGR